MNVEIVVAGALGELAMWAIPEVTAERRQVLVTSWSDTLDTLCYLTEHGLEIVTIRERAIPDGCRSRTRAGART